MKYPWERMSIIAIELDINEDNEDLTLNLQLNNGEVVQLNLMDLNEFLADEEYQLVLQHFRRHGR